jgi:hypothetical protein
VGQGEQVGVPTPINHTLWKLIQARVISGPEGERE